MSLSKKDLVKAAEELNEEIGPSPKIKTDVKIGKLKEQITKAGKLVEDDDDLSPETFAVLKELGFDFSNDAQEDNNDQEDNDDDSEDIVSDDNDNDNDNDDDPDDDNDDQEDNDVPNDETENDQEEENIGQDITEVVKSTKKLVDLKELVKENDEFKKLRKKLDDYKGLSGPRELKKKMLDILGVEEVSKSNAKKAEKKEKVPSAYGTTIDLMCQNPDMSKEALMKKLTKKEIDVENKKTAINTGYTTVRTIVKKLKENNHM